VLANDTDADGDMLTALLATPPSNGTLTFNADGSFTYTPRANFSGMDSFTYRARDGIVNSTPATVTITVTPVNDAPIACDDIYATHVNGALHRDSLSGVLSNDLDADLAIRQRIFSENFDSLPLGPFREEMGGDGTDWTNVPPAGWSTDNSRDLGSGDVGVPGINEGPLNNGIIDWAGWTFADRVAWATVAGDQNRSLFTKGTGVVAIADPDEWDDDTHPDGSFNTFLRTRPISLAGVMPNTLALTFDSSWRPERPGAADQQSDRPGPRLLRRRHDVQRGPALGFGQCRPSPGRLLPPG
jgi:VCBS repeat-containing protein